MVLRTSIQVAMQVAEALARRREQNLRTAAAAASEARSRALAGRLNAEQRSAEAFLHRAGDRQWWATAQDAQIIDAARVAHTWQDASPVAERAAVTIEERLRTDKGIDLTSLRDTVNTAVVAAAVERELADRAEREHQVDQNADRSVLGAPEALTMPPAHQLPSTTDDWDTAQRRELHRTELTIAGLDTEAIGAHLLTDTANAAALDSTSMRTPTAAPAATPGDREHDLDCSIDSAAALTGVGGETVRISQLGRPDQAGVDRIDPTVPALDSVAQPPHRTTHRDDLTVNSADDARTSPRTRGGPAVPTFIDAILVAGPGLPRCP